jgi:hypothetical protein
VRDFGGRIVAAVNVSARKFRFGDRLVEAGARVCADDLSATIGFDRAPLSSSRGRRARSPNAAPI